MKFFVTGALGQLGQDLRQYLPTDTIWSDRIVNDDLNVIKVDITDKNEVSEAIKKAKPDVIFHCAAYTNVDGAESDQNSAKLVNVAGTENIAKAAKDVRAKLIVISTDFVFDGKTNQPYLETDQANPISVYGKTKYEAEQIALKNCDKTFIVRTAWLYGPKKELAPVKNFPKTMLKLSNDHSEIRVVNDQIGSPTFTLDLAKAITTLSKTDQYGIWHIVNSGQTSWYNFARAVLADKIVKNKVIVKPISTAEYPTAARRPKYSVLDSSKFSKMFYPLRPWQEALVDFLVAH